MKNYWRVKGRISFVTTWKFVRRNGHGTSIVSPHEKSNLGGESLFEKNVKIRWSSRSILSFRMINNWTWRRGGGVIANVGSRDLSGSWASAPSAPLITHAHPQCIPRIPFVFLQAEKCATRLRGVRNATRCQLFGIVDKDVRSQCFLRFLRLWIFRRLEDFSLGKEKDIETGLYIYIYICTEY